MKYFLSILLLSLIMSCRSAIDIPDVYQETISQSSSITDRGLVDEKLVTDKPVITYVKSGITYTLTCNYPKINDINIQDYEWETVWNYCIKQKGGVKTITQTSVIKLTPVDILSAQVYVTAYNLKTGVKSKTLSTGIIIDLSKKKIVTK